MTLWNEGVRVWDEYKREHFTSRGLLFVTITDLPGLGSVSGQVTKGYQGCVVCLDDTHARWLTKIRRWFTWVIVGFFINIIHIIETRNPLMGQGKIA